MIKKVTCGSQIWWLEAEILQKVKNHINEDDEVKPILSYAKSKATNEKQLKNSGKKTA